jgi:hypothetical protein
MDKTIDFRTFRIIRKNSGDSMKKLSKEKIQLKQLQERYDGLAEAVRQYVRKLRELKGQKAGTFPAYGRDGEENIAGKSAPNVMFVKDLITQVMTAKNLGYDTQVTSDGRELVVEFTQPAPRLSIDMLTL